MEEYQPIPLEQIKKSQKPIPFDLFVQNHQGHYIHVFSKASGVFSQKLQHLEDKGHKEFFIRKAEVQKWAEFIKDDYKSLLFEEGWSEKRKIQVLEKISDHSITLFLKSLPQCHSQEVAIIAKSIQGALRCISESKKSLPFLFQIFSEPEFFWKRAIQGTALSLWLELKIDQEFKERYFNILCLGSLLRDIGMCGRSVAQTSVYQEDTTHPLLGFQRLEQLSNVPDEARTIVLQHHETIDGKGFPHQLKGPVIFRAAQMVSCSERLLELNSRTQMENVLTAYLHAIQQKHTRNLLSELWILLQTHSLFVENSAA